MKRSATLSMAGMVALEIYSPAIFPARLYSSAKPFVSWSGTNPQNPWLERGHQLWFNSHHDTIHGQLGLVAFSMYTDGIPVKFADFPPLHNMSSIIPHISRWRYMEILFRAII